MYTTLAAALFCASFFVRGARLEQRSPFLWGLMSVGCWIIGQALLGGWLLGGLLGQAALFAGLTFASLHRAGELPWPKR